MRKDWGTTAVLIVDLVATMSVTTWGILYLNADVKYIVIIAAITFGLALIIALLIRRNKSSRK